MSASCATIHAASITAAQAGLPMVNMAIRQVSWRSNAGITTARASSDVATEPETATPMRAITTTDHDRDRQHEPGGPPDLGPLLLGTCAAVAHLQRLSRQGLGGGDRDAEHQEGDGEGAELGRAH